jgi:predicted permease
MNGLRFALRVLWKSPIFTCISLLTLGLCIGANTAVYSVVDAVLLRPLPYPESDRLASVVTRFSSSGMSGEQVEQDGRSWQVLHENARSLDVAAFSEGAGGVNLVSGAGAQYVQQQRVSAGFFHALGVAPFIGKEFSAADDLPNGPPVVILSHALWVQDFHSSRSILGEKIFLRGEPYQVVGIMPRGFRTDAPADLWTPLRPSATGEGSGTNYRVLARLHPGVTWTKANAEVERIGRSAIQEHHYGASVSASLRLVPLQKGLTTELRVPLLVMWAAVGLVLLIGCVNVAGLLLTRSASRTREMATRMALGGGRAAVIGQLLLESLVLAVAGGALGVGIGWLALQALKRTALTALGIQAELVHLDGRVLTVALLTTLGTAIIFGVFPALRTARVDLLSVLMQSGSRTASAARDSWARRGFVIVEVALGVLILTSAGLLLRTFTNLISQPPGFDGRGVLTATLSLRDARYASSDRVIRLYHETLDRILKTPGVQSAGIGLSLPYSRALNGGFKRLDAVRTDSDFRITDEIYVTPGYFESLRMRLMRGRSFSWGDNASAEPVAIVNEAFARMYFKGQSPLGLHIEAGSAKRQIVGVTGDVQQSSGWGNFGPVGAAPTIYVPADQLQSDDLNLIHTWFTPAWVVRSSGTRQSVIAALQKAVASVDPQLPFAAFKSMDEVEADSVAFQRVMATLLSALGSLALLLAVLGIYGLIANTVLERTRELGIRMALGATVLQGMKAVVLPGLLLSAAGLFIGAIASLGATRLLGSLLWGVQPGDPLTVLSVCTLLFAFAFAASLIPALMVARIDPALSLRDE